MSRNPRQYASGKRQKFKNEYDSTSNSSYNRVNRTKNYYQPRQSFIEAPSSSTGYSYLTPDWLDSVHNKTHLQYSRDRTYKERRYQEPESMPSSSYHHYVYNRAHPQVFEPHRKDREEAHLLQRIAILQREIESVDAMREPNREVINGYTPEYSEDLYSRRSPIPKKRRYHYSSPRFSGISNSTEINVLPRLMDLDVDISSNSSRETISRAAAGRPTSNRTFRSSREKIGCNDEAKRRPQQRIAQGRKTHIGNDRTRKKKSSPRITEKLKDLTRPEQLEEISDNEEQIPMLGLKAAHLAVKKWTKNECIPPLILDTLSPEEPKEANDPFIEKDCPNLLVASTDQIDLVLPESSRALLAGKKDILKSWCHF